METETKAPRKVREMVTVDRCHQWLQLAYYETLRFGFCEPIKWLEQAGRKVLPTIARDKGYLLNAKHKGHSQWFNMKIQPNQEMAEILHDGYQDYRQKHGISQQNQRRAEAKEKAKLAQEAIDSVKPEQDVVRPEEPAVELAATSQETSEDAKQIMTAIMSLRVEVLALNEGMKHIQSVVSRAQTDAQSFMRDMRSFKAKAPAALGGNAEDRPAPDPF